MKYKRLTERRKDGFAHYKCSKQDIKDCGLYYNCGECHKSTEALYRLAELEDKIENGTLIEIPKILQDKKGDWRVYFYSERYGLIDCYVYDTREEAEQMYKQMEMQGKLIQEVKSAMKESEQEFLKEFEEYGLQVRKETAEKFAERLKDLVAERNCNEDYDWEDVQVDGHIFVECIDEIAKELTEGNGND